MIFIDDLVKSYRFRARESAFFERCRKEGVDCARLPQAPKLWSEYQSIIDDRPEVYHHFRFADYANGFGVLAYDVVHPWRRRDDLKTNAQIFMGAITRMNEKQPGIIQETWLREYEKRPETCAFGFPYKQRVAGMLMIVGMTGAVGSLMAANYLDYRETYRQVSAQAATIADADGNGVTSSQEWRKVYEYLGVKFEENSTKKLSYTQLKAYIDGHKKQ